MPALMFFLVEAFIAAANGANALRSLRQRDPRDEPSQASQASPIPLAGGLLMAAGMLTAPLTVLHTFAWVPLFLDYGCLPTIGRAAAFALFGRPQHSAHVALLDVEANVHRSSIHAAADAPPAAQSTLANDHVDGNGSSASR